jgi:membrane fusion protein, multidrug efflux system
MTGWMRTIARVTGLSLGAVLAVVAADRAGLVDGVLVQAGQAQSAPAQSGSSQTGAAQSGSSQSGPSQSGPSQSGSQPAPNAIPVMTAKVVRQDVPIYAEGVGTIQPYQSVLIRSRVDGQLMQVPVAEGQMVKQGDLVALIDPRPYQAALDQAKAKQAQDAAQLANAQRDLVRYQSLSKQDFASRQQVDTQQALVNQYTAAIQGDTAAIEAAQINLDYCSITSPVDGRMGLRLIDPGNLVHANDTNGIVTITQVHPIALDFTLPQTVLPSVQTSMAKGTLPVQAFTTDDQQALGEGTLLTPDNTIDTTTGTIKMKAVFPNQDNRLWPGQFVNAHLQLSITPQAVTVPPAAVQHGPDGLYVYVVKPDNTVADQPITAGYQTPKVAIVTAGLSGGETVVVSGQSRLQPGVHVAATASAAAS